MIRQEDEPLPVAPGQSCDEAFRRIALPCLAEIDCQLAAYFGTEAEVGPHKCRVALRRLTTAMDAFAPILRRQQAAALRREAKEIFRILGEQRDADVYLAGLPAGRRRDKLEAETTALRDRLRERLRARKAVALAPRLRALLDNGEMFRAGEKAVIRRQEPVEEFAREVLDDAWETCRSHGRDIGSMGGRDQHEFRKDMKTLRYLAEFFAPLWDGAGTGHDSFREEMQALQDALGLLNDLRTARAKGRKPAPEAAKQAEAALRAAQDGWDDLTARGAPWWPAGDEAQAK